MKQNSNKQDKSIKEVNDEITRKDALIKVGKYAAVTAAAMLIVLSPKQSQAGSPPTPGWGS